MSRNGQNTQNLINIVITFTFYIHSSETYPGRMGGGGKLSYIKRMGVLVAPIRG